MFTKIAGTSLIAMTFLVASTVSAQDAAPLTPPSVSGGAVVGKQHGSVGAVGYVTARGTITNVNAGAREFTVKRPNGAEVIVPASDKVKNFDQIKVGDQVVLRQAQAVVMTLKKTGGHSGIRERDVTDVTDVAKAGDKPGIAAARETRIVADVTALNKKAGTITLRGVHESRTLHVTDKTLLADVSKGDQVEVVVAEGEALSIEAAKAK